MIFQENDNFRLRRQWYLGTQAPSPRIDWQKLPISLGYTLYYHSDLKVIYSLVDGIGVIIIGIAINPHKPYNNPIIELQCSLNDIDLLEKNIELLGGSYVVIVSLAQKIMVYNDPAGMMGVYYGGGCTASTLTLLSPLKKNNDINDDIEFGPGNDWYTGSTTSNKNIKKLIPNCSLNVIDGSIKRFWPKSFHFHDDYSETQSTLNAIVHLLEGMMSGVVSHGQVICSITGGYDSRVVLAACKAHWQFINFFTLRADWIQKDDIKYAAMLARETNINHTFYDIVSTPKWLDELYNEIGVNESIGTRRNIIGTCLLLAGKDTIHVNGNLGALFKSFYWHNNRPTSFKVSAVIRDFVNPGSTIINGVNEWRETVSGINNASILYNLFYLEQRGGRWMSAGENCSRLFYESFTPFNQRKIFSLICTLPLEMQYGGHALKLLVEKMAPELLRIPYCKARRNWSKYIPGKVKNKIKQILKKK
jgi:hypothetical protein